MNIYAGIGSRSTPADILPIMTQIASCLGSQGWVLRSGYADGADQAFEAGATYKEIYLPWEGFNGSKRGQAGHIVPDFNPGVLAIAKDYHPNWAACSSAARLLHMRNVCQILGADCRSPADLVICWTPRGSGSGGTGQAIRIAKGFDIPVFDIALLEKQQELCQFLQERDAA